VRKRYRNIDGESKYITIMYLFQYAPQSWREIQRLASIKVQMKRIIPSIVLMEEDISSYVSSAEDVGKI